jgi:hypothetical protein
VNAGSRPGKPKQRRSVRSWFTSLFSFLRRSDGGSELPGFPWLRFRVCSELAPLPELPADVKDVIAENRLLLQDGSLYAPFTRVEFCGLLSAKITNDYGDSFTATLHSACACKPIKRKY